MDPVRSFPRRTALGGVAVLLGALVVHAAEAPSVVVASGDHVARTTAAPSAKAPSVTARRALTALATATSSVRNGRPYDIEADRYRGRPVWEVTVAVRAARPHLLRISADGERVLTHRRRRPEADATRAWRARVPLARAIRVADRRVRGIFREADIERHRGVVVWSVEFLRPGARGEVEVTVSARTGAVMRVEVDDR